MAQNSWKPFTLSLVLLLAAALASAQGAKKPAYTLSVTTEAGILQGEVLEIVYLGPNSLSLPSDYMVSRLDWALELLPFWGSRLDLSAGKGFYASLGLRSALPGRYGSIEDRDWLNYDGVLTHYSKHDNYVERAFFADLAAGWKFRTSDAFSYSLGLGLDLMSLKWTGREGYLKYPSSGSEGSYVPWTEGDPIYDVYGTGLAYEQFYLIPSLGAEASYSLNEDWKISASFSFSALAYCEDLDNHFLRVDADDDTDSANPVDVIYNYVGMEFYEWMYPGLSLAPGLKVERRIGERSYLSLSGAYRLIMRLKGYTTIQYNGIEDLDQLAGIQDGPYKDSGGAAYSALSLGLALRMEL